MIMARNKVIVLNISSSTLSEKKVNVIKDNIVESTCGIIQDIHIVDLPRNLKIQWDAMTPDNFKNVCDKIRRFMNKNNIHRAYLDGFVPSVVELTKWSYEFYYIFNDKCFKY